jgi:hypothetical protein
VSSENYSRDALSWSWTQPSVQGLFESRGHEAPSKADSSLALVTTTLLVHHGSSDECQELWASGTHFCRARWPPTSAT